MKKIDYFGKEYTVSNDVKWVATCPSGNVITFTERPWIILGTWAAPGGSSRIDISAPGAIDWKNSLRKVEDILVKENKLKVGDKVMVNVDVFGFKKGQIVEVYKLDDDGFHLFKGDNPKFKHCDGEDGAYLLDYYYTIIKETTTPSGHPHADLMLKYAMIAQYDDKPWENFECAMSNGSEWCAMITEGFFCNLKYRLKPQEPKIQIGQIWVSKEGVGVVVDTPSSKNTIHFKYHLGGLLMNGSVSFTHFIKNFKRKE